MTTPVKYFIAQYIPDVFRREPRNVGVFALKNEVVEARFYGETAPAQIDGRKLRIFASPEAYRQWVDYWRSLASKPAPELAELLERSSGANYRVITGGEITDTGSDSISDVVRYLYSVLVSEGGLMEALGTIELGDDVGSGRLKNQLAEEFAAANIFAKGNVELPLVPHPVREKIAVSGTVDEPHVPAFTQQNGLLYVMETVDFTAQAKERAKEHAGFASYMFEDIRNAHKDYARTIAVVRAREEDKDFASVRYGLSILKHEATDIVDWNDVNARNAFLAERQRVALQHNL